MSDWDIATVRAGFTATIDELLACDDRATIVGELQRIANLAQH